MKWIKVAPGHYESEDGRVVIKLHKSQPYAKEGPSFWTLSDERFEDHRFVSLRAAKAAAERAIR